MSSLMHKAAKHPVSSKEFSNKHNSGYDIFFFAAPNQAEQTRPINISFWNIQTKHENQWLSTDRQLLNLHFRFI